MQIRSTAFLSVVAAALVLAACRGGDEATPTPTRTPTPTPTATATATATATSTPATGDSGQRDETSLGAFTGDDPCDAIEYVWQRPEGSPLPDRPHQTPRTDFGKGLRDYAEDILDGEVECVIEVEVDGEAVAMVAVESGRDATQADVDRVLADLRSAGIAVAGGAISLGPFTVIPFEGLRIDDQDTAGAVFYPGGPFGLVSAGPVGRQAGGAGGVLYSPGGEGRIRRRP